MTSVLAHGGGTMILVLLFAVLFAEPGRAQSQEALAAGGAAVWLGAAVLADDEARELLAAAEGESSTMAGVGWQLGRAELVVPFMGGAYLAGELFDQSRLAGGALHGLAALAAAGMVNGALKAGLGRARPELGRGAASFRPFTLDDDWQSFPSGHATVAFTLATVLDLETESVMVSVIGYSSAALVAWSRIYRDRHWLSDSVAGAVVGSGAAWWVLDWLHANDATPHAAAIAPRISVGPSGVGVSVPVPSF